MTPQERYHVMQGYRSLMRAIPVEYRGNVKERRDLYRMKGNLYNVALAANNARLALISGEELTPLKLALRELSYASTRIVKLSTFKGRTNSPSLRETPLSDINPDDVYPAAPVQQTLSLYVEKRKLPVELTGYAFAKNPITAYRPIRSAIWDARGLTLYHGYMPMKVTGGWQMKVIYIVQENNSKTWGASIKSSAEAATDCHDKCVMKLKKEMERDKENDT